MRLAKMNVPIPKKREKPFFSSFLTKLRKKKIIPILAAFIGGGVAVVEFVHHIIVNHYHLPKYTVDITIITVVFALVCTLVWQWIRGEKRELIEEPKAEIISTPEWKSSIVVLPFENISPEEGQEYFCDGMTEEIITDLSKIHSLRVISRNSAMMLKSTRKATKTIRRELNVQYVLEGSVRKAGNDLRISAQLIDAKNDAHLWAEKYSGTLNDVFDIQEKVSRSIADALKLKLSPEEDNRITDRTIDNVQVYEWYFKARQEITLQTEDGLERALQYLNHGINIAGDNALLHSSMGYVYFHYVNLGIKGEDYIGKAEECVKKAFELDPESPKGHVLLGIFNQVFRGNQQQSVLHFKRALAVDEYDPDALFWLGLGYAAYTGKTFAAIPLVDRLSQIDPLFPFSIWLLAVPHFFEGRYDLALVQWQKAHQMVPDAPLGQFFYAIALAYNKCFEEAFTVINQSAETSPQHSYTQLGLFCKYAFQGNKTEALSYLSQELETWLKRDGWYSWHVAVGYALLDMKQEALDWLENAANRGFINYPFLNERDPFLENIRGEERFKKLMERIKYEWEHFEV